MFGPRAAKHLATVHVRFPPPGGLYIYLSSRFKACHAFFSLRSFWLKGLNAAVPGCCPLGGRRSEIGLRSRCNRAWREPILWHVASDSDGTSFFQPGHLFHPFSNSVCLFQPGDIFFSTWISSINFSSIFELGSSFQPCCVFSNPGPLFLQSCFVST